MARRYNYQNATSAHDQSPWNTHSPSRLIESVPLMLSYAPNYDNGFIKHLNLIKKLVTWLENESDIFDKSLLNEAQFNQMKNEIDNVNNCVLNGLKDCNDLIENNLI